jgi:gliding motility-associated-like protein
MLTVSNGACTEKDSVTIDVKPAPVVTKSNDTTICNLGQASLFAGGGIAYQWSPSAGLNNSNVSNPVASPAASTKYYVTVTGVNGCERNDSVTVGWQPKPVFAINPITVAICSGDSTSLTASGADTYYWFEGSNILTPNNAATLVYPNATQQFGVALQHTFCRINDTLRSMVTVNDLPAASIAKSNDIDCSNGSATLSATGGTSYSWFPQTAMNGGNSATPVVSPQATTIYYVNVVNSNGCTDTDSVTVNVLFNPIAGGYHMPDAFTPNNDYKNDCFGLRYWGVVQDLDFSVFNRWGERIFHTSNVTNCWDGTYKGIPQASGTYIYQIKAKTACGDVFKKGTVVLMR